MADVYYDPNASGTNLGTSWTNAYETIDLALNGTNVGADDTLWVKNNKTDYGTITLKGPSGWTNNPPRVIGVKAATSATPPTASDIIPGLRNGSSTRAYDQVSGNAAPIITTSANLSDLSFSGYFGLIYGIVCKAHDQILFNNVAEGEIWAVEECEIAIGQQVGGEFRLGAGNADKAKAIFKNSKISAATDGRWKLAFSAGHYIFDGCEIDIPSGIMIFIGNQRMDFTGCNFSSQSGTILNITDVAPQTSVNLSNCKIHASSALTTGTIVESFEFVFAQTSSVTGKTTGGSFLELDIITSEGDIVLETTAVRTGGADDGGDGAWSLAFTPGVNGTRDNLIGLVGPWISQKIVGDGTAQTLTVHFANDLAEDAGNKYDNDEVWIELRAPSESGTADYDYYTTQMDLGATPSEITTETVGWGTGAANDQRLSITLAPDYNGLLQWRVIFSKNFGATPDTLYVDPKAVLS